MKYCDNCKVERPKSEIFCANCGKKLVLKKKVDIFDIFSIISLIMVVVAILANVLYIWAGFNGVFEDGNVFAFSWIIFILIPSFLLIGLSFIFSLISTISYIVKIVKKDIRKPIKTILFIISIIVISFVICLVFLFIRMLRTNRNFDLKDNWKIEYSMSKIESMFVEYEGEEELTNQVTEENIHKYDQLLLFIDSVVGKGEYYLASLYSIEKGNWGFTKDNYIVKIIPKGYINEFNAWDGSLVTNPYLVMFTLEAENDEHQYWQEGIYDEYYTTFVIGMEYQNRFDKELTSDNNYKFLVDYNPFLHISQKELNVQRYSFDFDDGLNKLKEKQITSSGLVIVPSHIQKPDIDNYIYTNEETFKKYFVRNIKTCILKENEQIIDYINVTEFDSKFQICHSYSVE